MSLTPQVRSDSMALPRGRPRRDAVLLLRLKDRFLAYKRLQQRKESTIANYESDLMHFFSNLPRRDITALTKDAIEDYQAHLVNHGYRRGGVNRKLSVLSEFCRYLVSHDHLRLNPMQGCVRPKKARRLPEILSQEEMRVLLALELSPREAAIRAILCYTGARRGAIRRLDLRDLKFDLGTMIFREGKGDQDLSVPMAPAVTQALQAWISVRGEGTPEDPVFPGALATRIHVNSLYAMVRRWGRAIGRPKLHPHLFRHSFITQHLDLFRDIKATQDISGHRDISTTMRYVHLVQTKLAEQMREFDYRTAEKISDTA